MTHAAAAALAAPTTRTRAGFGDDTGASGRLAMVLDPMRLMLIALTIINISRVHQSVPALVKLRPGLLLVVAAAGYAYMNAKSLTRANIMAFWPMRRVALLAVVSVASVAFGIALGKSALFILNGFSKTVLFAFLITLCVRHVRDLYTFVWALAASCGILSFLSIFVFKVTKSEWSHTGRVESLYMYDANDVCVVMLVGLGSVLLLLSVARGWQRGVLFLIVVGISATIARSGSRGGFLGLAAFGLAALILLSSISPMKRLVILMSVVVGVALFSPPGYMDQMATILSPSKDYNTTTANGRKALILRGLHYVSVYPFFGVGINAFGNAECDPKLSGIGTGAGGSRCGAPHNSYIEAAAETGLVGFAVWVSMVFGGIYSMLKLRRRLPQHWKRGSTTERFLYGATTHFAVALVGFAVSSFFVSFAWIDILYLQIALISGLYLSIAMYTSTPAASSAVPAAALRRVPGWRVKQSALRSLALTRVPQLPAPR